MSALLPIDLFQTVKLQLVRNSRSRGLWLFRAAFPDIAAVSHHVFLEGAVKEMRKRRPPAAPASSLFSSAVLRGDPFNRQMMHVGAFTRMFEGECAHITIGIQV